MQQNSSQISELFTFYYLGGATTRATKKKQETLGLLLKELTGKYIKSILFLCFFVQNLVILVVKIPE